MDNEIKFFEDYVSKFDKNNNLVDLKYKHTYRVVGYAKEIARSLNLDEREFNRACICALFHDLGRFTQIKEYNTFCDKKSFDHGDKGYEILKEINYKDDIVLKAVKYHNKKEIPTFDELTDLHCKLVRDADKLDILTYFDNDEYEGDFKVSDETLNDFKNHTQVSNKSEESKFDAFLRSIAFIFDINYKKSIELLIENNVLNTKLNILKKAISNEQYLVIEKELKEYIKERFDIEC